VRVLVQRAIFRRAIKDSALTFSPRLFPFPQGKVILLQLTVRLYMLDLWAN
jgi:hypothetical protein